MIILAINQYEKGVNGLKRILTPRSLSAALALTILLSFACVKASAYSEGANDTTSSELWNKDGVNYCLDTGLMAGTDKGIEPYAAATRAMAVTMIYRMEGQPPMGGGKSGTFSDVPEYAWYTDAVEWAAAFGIAAGYGDGSFGPGDELSREQLAAMLYRYALYKGRDVSIGEDTNILSYDDAFDIGEYAISAIHWAVGSAIITGRTDSTINPLDGASRTELALILMRYDATLVTGAFADVASIEITSADVSETLSAEAARQLFKALETCTHSVRAYPEHMAAQTSDPMYTITVTYTGGNTDTVFSTETGLFYYRFLDTLGNQGDRGYVYTSDPAI